MDSERLKYLLARFKNLESNDNEIDELNEWFHSIDHGNAHLQDWINEAGGKEQLETLLYQNFKQKTSKQANVHTLRFIAKAAAVLSAVIIIAGIWFGGRSKPAATLAAKRNTPSANIMPGRNTAQLTLANGKTVSLDDFQNDEMILQTGVSIRKMAEGRLQYTMQPTVSNAGLSGTYNTIATPKAGQYELILSDGTKVWLNAATSLRYPTNFNGKERRVELNGEAYFEVAHNKQKPFKVITGTQTVTVLGTHFNIKGYTDDAAITTTLLQGSVKVADNQTNTFKLLIPGKKAELFDDIKDIRISAANVDQVMAWKNGYFIFDDQDIRSIMKLISRWYDVDVEYHLNSNEHFGGTFSRASDLNRLLKNLESLGKTKFNLKGRRIIVSN